MRREKFGVPFLGLHLEQYGIAHDIEPGMTNDERRSPRNAIDHAFLLLLRRVHNCVYGIFAHRFLLTCAQS